MKISLKIIHYQSLAFGGSYQAFWSFDLISETFSMFDSWFMSRFIKNLWSERFWRRKKVKSEPKTSWQLLASGSTLIIIIDRAFLSAKLNSQFLGTPRKNLINTKFTFCISRQVYRPCCEWEKYTKTESHHEKVIGLAHRAIWSSIIKPQRMESARVEWSKAQHKMLINSWWNCISSERKHENSSIHRIDVFKAGFRFQLDFSTANAT